MIAVTGASGYLGSHITRSLVLAGKPVRALVHNPARAQSEGRLQGLNVEWAQADVTQPGTLAAAMQGVEAVIHTVAIAIEKGDQTYERINTEGTRNVLEAAWQAGVRRFIFISQLGADARLPYRFLASKGRADDLVRASGLDWTVFNPSVIWGPEDEFANTFARLVPLSPLIFPIVGDQNSKFQPVWVDDVAAAVTAALDDPATIGKGYELGGPEVLTLEEIERRTLEALGSKRWLIRFPMPLLKIVVAVMQILLPSPPVTRSLLELLAVSNVPKQNDIQRFVAEPRPFTASNARPYMREFKLRDTLRQFFGKV